MCSANIVLKLEAALGKDSIKIIIDNKNDSIELKKSVFFSQEIKKITKILNRSKACKGYYMNSLTPGQVSFKINL